MTTNEALEHISYENPARRKAVGDNILRHIDTKMGTAGMVMHVLEELKPYMNTS